MTTLTFPSIVPTQVTWHLEPNTAAFVSPLSRAVQTIELAGARWVCSMSLPVMGASTWREWSAWIAKMRGQAGRVYYGPPHYLGAQAQTWTPNLGAITCDSTAVTCDSTATQVNQTAETPVGTPVIDGSGQAGEYLRVRGYVGDVSVLAAGDYLSYDTSRGRTLHMVVEDVRTGGAGRARIRIEPPIRVAPDDGDDINTSTPTCIMTVRDGMSGAPTWRPYLKASVDIDLVEVFS